MKLIPITPDSTNLEQYLTQDFIKQAFEGTQQMYRELGFEPPWVGYVAVENDKAVGVGGFKGKPNHNALEIAYATIPEFENMGYGSSICRHLVDIALDYDQTLRVTARTLPNPSASTRILQKNNFLKLGSVQDPEDGHVWEWEYQQL